jgi:hypothetical protein
MPICRLSVQTPSGSVSNWLTMATPRAGTVPGASSRAAEQRRPLDAVLAQAQPPLDITQDGQVRLCAEPAGQLADGLVRLLLIIRDAQADGTATSAPASGPR